MQSVVVNKVNEDYILYVFVVITTLLLTKCFPYHHIYTTNTTTNNSNNIVLYNTIVFVLLYYTVINVLTACNAVDLIMEKLCIKAGISNYRKKVHEGYRSRVCF